MADEIIDAKDLADMLKCGVAQVEEAAREGRIPALKEGRAWLFVRLDVIAFLAERARDEAAERRARYAKPASNTVLAPTKRKRRIPPPLF